ncbi:MAG: hypothetical protein ACO4AK_00180 [Candidatus Nanopelagicales bacterium]
MTVCLWPPPLVGACDTPLHAAPSLADVGRLASGAVMGSPGPCPACESVDLERRGGKDFCPRCHYIQPCCDGGECAI